MEELTEKEKEYLLTILYKQSWTECAICDSIIRKLRLRKFEDHETVSHKIKNEVMKWMKAIIGTN